MARLLRATRRAFLSSSISSSLSFKTLITPVRQPFPQIDPLCNSVMQTRNFMADMRKSHFDGTLLRILSNEIQYECEYAPLAQVSLSLFNLVSQLCLAWPDCLEVQNVFVLPREGVPGRPYVGPDFKDLDDKLQDSMLEFLEARGVNDELAVFLHEYIMNKGRTELIRWLSNVRSFVEK